MISNTCRRTLAFLLAAIMLFCLASVPVLADEEIPAAAAAGTGSVPEPEPAAPATPDAYPEPAEPDADSPVDTPADTPADAPDTDDDIPSDIPTDVGGDETALPDTWPDEIAPVEPDSEPAPDNWQTEPDDIDGEVEDAGVDEITGTGDPSADAESAAYWAQMFAGTELTVSYGEDVIQVALSQLGYCESVRNYIIMNGEMYGYTRYGAWYGIPYGDWCCMFVCYCLFYAGVYESIVPYSAGVDSFISMLNARNMFAYASSGYIPNPGDLVFFDWEPDYDADHVGFVYEVIYDDAGYPATLVTIEGNSGDMVRMNTYNFYDSRLFGYGILPGNSGVFSKAYDCSVSREELAGMDFSSHRLLFSGDPAVLTDETYVLGRYEDCYLLLFSSATEARNAFTYYVDQSDYCAPDIYLAPAEDDGLAFSSMTPPDTDGMTARDNPLSNLSALLRAEAASAALESLASSEADVGEKQPDDDRAEALTVALIDTGVNDESVERCTVLCAPGGEIIDDDGESLLGDDNGHGDDMLAHIRAENPDAEVISIKAMGADGVTCVSRLIAAIELAAAKGADIIDLSLSARSVTANPALAEAVSRAIASGCVVVAAAGNYADDASLYTPGNIDGVITAAAVAFTDAESVLLHGEGVSLEDVTLYTRAELSLSGGSNYGDAVDWYVIADSTSEAAAKLCGILSTVDSLDDIGDIGDALNVRAAVTDAEQLCFTDAWDTAELLLRNGEVVTMDEAEIAEILSPAESVAAEAALVEPAMK